MSICFLTGATGFLGYALALDLLEAGYTVRALSRSGELPGELQQLGVQVVRGDLSDPKILESALGEVETVFHVAAELGMWSRGWLQSYHTNVEGTANLVEAAVRAGCRRFVYTSSGSTIGKPWQMGSATGAEPPIVDESHAYNFAPLALTYPHTKWLGEKVVERAADQGLEGITTHPTMILGPWDWKHNLLPLFRGARGYGWITVPKGWRSICDVRDVARGHRLAAEQGTPGRHYILGGSSLPCRELFRQLAGICGGKAPLVELPDRVVVGAARVLEALAVLRNRPPLVSVEMAVQSTFRVQVSSARAEVELGYRSRPLDQTLRDAAQWYRHQGLL